MARKEKGKLMRIGGVMLLAIVVILFIFLLKIRNEFINYIDTKYPELSFKVGFTKVDIIYGKYIASGTCLNDGTKFAISKVFKTKAIYEDYPQAKGINQYNSRIKKIFDGSDIQKEIKSVIGGGKIPFGDNALYEQVGIILVSGTDHIIVVKKVLNILKEKNINADKITFTYEKGNSVYELWLSSNDFNLSEKEIESRVRKIK